MIDEADRAKLKDRLGGFSADLALVNANVVTMNPAQPKAQAVAIKNGRITAVGSDRVIRQTCGRNTQVIDLGGKTLLPGFVESHNHVSAYSHIVLQIDCTPRTCRSIDDILKHVKARAASQPKGTWIEGYGFDNTALVETALDQPLGIG